MLVQVNYLRNHKSVDVGPFLSALCEEIERAGVDPTHLLITLDWLQYRNNFRLAVDPRRYLLSLDEPNSEREMAVDVRRLNSEQLRQQLSHALDYLYRVPEPVDRLVLEGFVPPGQSLMWTFNRTFWQHISTWERTFQRGFLSALPGGVSDGTNPEFWNERIGVFLDILDDLDRRSLVPDEIYVLELGVGTGQQGKVWLDTFREQCAFRGRDYYGRVRYLMTDYSHDVLHMARETIAEHGDKVSCINLDVTDPLHTLSFLRYKALFIHSCNLYDNLPTNEVARRNGTFYEVQTRAYIPQEDVQSICGGHHLEAAGLGQTIQRFLRIGPEYFDDVVAGVQFWADVWNAVRLEERYVALEDPTSYRIAPNLRAVDLEELLAGFPGDIRIHMSTAALQSFANTLPLLHPQGIFQVQDLFVRELEQYRGTFRGPGKMDGSIVNWLNGPLFGQIAGQLGYTVHLEPFRYRERSNTVVLTTSQKE